MRPRLLLALSLIFLPGGWLYAADNDRWEAAIGAFESDDQQHPGREVEIFFLGSSSIRMWDLDRWFPDRSALNRGFGGSQISDSVRYFDRILGEHQPRWIVFYAGDNDIAAGESAEEVVADFAGFLDRVRSDLPDTSVAFLAIKPSLLRWNLVDDMRRANARIAALADKDPRLLFVDVDAPMLGADGKPRPELFVDDGLHLSADGYALWTEILRRALDLSPQPDHD